MDTYKHALLDFFMSPTPFASVNFKIKGFGQDVGISLADCTKREAGYLEDPVV